MGVFSELDLENRQANRANLETKQTEMEETAQAFLIRQHEQKKAAVLEESNSGSKAETSAKKEERQEATNTAEAEKRRQHEQAEAERKAEWERQQQEKKLAEQEALSSIARMNETELLKASMERMKKETERLTRRNLKECVSEYVQTICLSDAAFARMVMHPRKSMAHCIRYINRKAREYLLEEMKDNGIEQPNGIYGGDVPEDTCYEWAEEYYRDANAKEDEIKEEKFVPKPYPGVSASKSKSQTKKEKTAAEKQAPKQISVIPMPQAEDPADKEQVSMFEMLGGMAG